MRFVSVHELGSIKFCKEKITYTYISQYLTKLLRRFIYLFLVYLSEHVSYGLILRFSPVSIPYPIEKRIVSPATEVIFLRSIHRSGQQICVKIWRPCDNELYNTLDNHDCIHFLAEGLTFNSRFAQDIYLGIARIEVYNNFIRLGKLRRKPNETELQPDGTYALVMKRLDDTWRLDHQLTKKAGKEDLVWFLAREVAQMHRSFEELPGSREFRLSIESKLDLNLHLFQKALDSMQAKSIFMTCSVDVKEYEKIKIIMNQSRMLLAEHFESRSIRRCHGDLKATNLWIRSARGKHGRQLLALDCVDFNPSFCYIDPLSDIAMLAVDIEARYNDWITDDKRQIGHKRAKWFLATYLKAAQENDRARWTLLEYYMTEKAMICAYMSILFDGLPILGLRYLEVALRHARHLDKRLEERTKFLPSATEATETRGSVTHSN